MPVDDLLGVGVLRPGYTDGKGDRSTGEMGMAALDNFTPEVVDTIATVVRVLKGQSQARRIVLVGHSGGATIAANILGRNPGLVEVALLIACAADTADPIGKSLPLTRARAFGVRARCA